MPTRDLAAMRRHYQAAGLTESELAEDPFTQFERWFADAGDAGLEEPNAMVVSTADAAGRPSSRTVLLKAWDEHGFVFYTNYDSRKASDLAANPHVALLFPWHPIARQVIVAGTAARTGRAETAAYFRTRPYGSRIGAWASEQSQPLPPGSGREALERRYAELAARYPAHGGAEADGAADVPVPPHWGGFRVRPETVEFWQGRENRLHDRLRYRRARRRPDGSAPPHGAGGDGGWEVERLNP